jgi:hypothetical protein
MKDWREVWRKGLAPLLSKAGLEAVRVGLVGDDVRILQGATTNPPPLHCVANWPAEAACVIGYCSWQGDGLETVAEVEEYFTRTCFAIDQRLGEPGACRWFLNWYDETPRAEMRGLLAAEVSRGLAERLGVVADEVEMDGAGAEAA